MVWPGCENSTTGRAAATSARSPPSPPTSELRTEISITLQFVEYEYVVAAGLRFVVVGGVALLVVAVQLVPYGMLEFIVAVDRGVQHTQAVANYAYKN